MLVLTRQKSEVVVIGDGIRVTVVELRGDRVRLGFDAPPGVAVDREEIWIEKQKGDSGAEH